MNPGVWIKSLLTDRALFALRLQRGLRQHEYDRRVAAMDLETERRRSIEFLSRNTQQDAGGLLKAFRASEFPKQFQARLEALRARSPGRQTWISPNFDCETIYLVVRSLRPQTVVETGALYGAFSAHILQALHDNGGGQLISLDLPNPRPDDPPKDFLVPEHLRGRSRLILGDVKESMPRLLRELKTIDMFLHDSDHTFPHMTWEFVAANTAVRAGGVIASHDAIATAHYPDAFTVFASAAGFSHDIFRVVGVGFKPA